MARLGPDEGEAMKAVVAAADLVRVRARVRVWARVRARARARARGPRLGLGLLGFTASYHHAASADDGRREDGRA